MNKHFFELPKAVKRAVWAALMAEWAKKKAASRSWVTGLQDRFSSSDLAMILPAFAGKVKRTLSRAAPLPQKQPYATAPPGQIKIKRRSRT